MEENKKISWFAKHKVLTVIIGLFLFGSIMSAANGGSNDDSAKNDSSSSSSTPNSDNSVEETPTEEPTQEEVPAVPAEYLSALDKAQSYSDNMNMSKLGIYDQLVSEYGEQFTKAAAQYGIDNVDADWNYNALQKAKSYQENMSMSPAAIRDQLTSSYGEKFTKAEADYAVSHLND